MAAPHLPDVLLARADTTPDAVAYELVTSDGVVTLDHADLAGRALALAAEIARCGDGPVLVARPAGLEYVVAVFAALLAGRPVIPADEPGAGPGEDRLAGIVADARPAVVVTTRPTLVPGDAAVLPVPPPGTAGPGADRRVVGSDVAVLQYTSGSTRRPRGVLVRHESVTANTSAIAERLGVGTGSRTVTWLPPFHDMGLVGGLLTPMAVGFPSRILRPADFLKAPLSWLREMSDTAADVSGGPNFAYDLCVRRAGEAVMEGLDLSAWRVAYSGGEPVSARTLASFAARFAPVGFRAEAFTPCYGLAEATLMVSAGHWSPSADRSGPVACGAPVTGQEVRVVDPAGPTVVEDGTEGEIWVSGVHVTHGYLRGEDDDLFGEVEGRRMLRTGDLGFVDDGEVHVTGRVKDVIVFRGVNHHAVDVEQVALEATAGRCAVAAAFGIETADETSPAIVLEVRGEADRTLAERVRSAVLARSRLPLDVVALVPPQSVPRTSSGKVRRSAARDLLTSGAFDGALVLASPAAGPRTDPGAASAAELADLVCGVVAGVCDLPSVDPADELADRGVDSLRAAEAAAVLEHALSLPVPLGTVLTQPTSGDVATALLEGWRASGVEADEVHRRVVALRAEGAPEPAADLVAPASGGAS